MWSVDKRYLNDSHFVKKKRNAFVASRADKIILNNNKDGARVFDLSDRQNGPFNSSRASYFHNSIGGYDIFVSHFDMTTKDWGKPKNIGYPLNNPYDNISSASSHTINLIFSVIK